MVWACSTVELAVDEVVTAVDAGAPLVVVHGGRGCGLTSVCDAARARLDDRGLVVLDDADRQTGVVERIEAAVEMGTPVVISVVDISALGSDGPAPTWVSVGPVPVEDVAGFLELNDIRGASAARVHQLTGGNLRTLVELVASAPAEAWPGRDLDQDALRRLPVTSEARAELARLPVPTRNSLCLAAHADDESLAVVERALASVELDAGALASAETTGMIAIDGDRIRFRRPVDRVAARESAPLAERRRLVAALAEQARTGPIDRSAWYEAQWAAGPDDELAERLGRLGENELADRLLLRAAATWQLAHRFRGTPTGHELVRAAEAAVTAGEFDLAGRLADTAGRMTPRDDVKAAAARIGVLVDTWRGRPTASLPRADHAVSDDGPPAVTAALLLQATVAALHAGHLDDAERRANRAAEVAKDLGPLGAAAKAIAGYTASLRGDPEGRRDLEVVLTLHCELEPIVAAEPSVLHLTSWIGRILAEGGHPAAAADMLEWTIHTADLLGATSLLVMPLVHRASLRLRLAGPRSAADDVARLAGLVDELGLHEHRVSADLIRGRSEALAGDPAAEQRLRDVAARSRGPAEVEAYLALGTSALATGDVDAAVSWLQHAAQRSASVGLGHPGFLPYDAELVEALVRSGRPAEAAERADELGRVAAAWGDPFVTALADRAAGLTSDDLDSVERHLGRSIAAFDDLGAPLEAARSTLCLGEQRRRHRQRADARDPLRTARLTFERLGARAWISRCDDELRAAGAGGGDGRGREAALTEREQRIAELAGGGATNREIAAALHLSPKTVENQLTRIYAKLHVRSRTELARRFGDGG